MQSKTLPKIVLIFAVVLFMDNADTAQKAPSPHEKAFSLAQQESKKSLQKAQIQAAQVALYAAQKALSQAEMMQKIPSAKATYDKLMPQLKKNVADAQKALNALQAPPPPPAPTPAKTKIPAALGPVAQSLAEILNKIVVIRTSNGQYIRLGGDKEDYWFSATGDSHDATHFTVRKNPDGSVILSSTSPWGVLNMGSSNKEIKGALICPPYGVMINRNNIFTAQQQSWIISFIPAGIANAWAFVDQKNVVTKKVAQFKNVATRSYLNNQGTATSGGKKSCLKTCSLAGHAMIDAKNIHTQFQCEIVGQAPVLAATQPLVPPQTPETTVVKKPEQKPAGKK